MENCLLGDVMGTESLMVLFSQLDTKEDMVVVWGEGWGGGC